MIRRIIIPLILIGTVLVLSLITLTGLIAFNRRLFGEAFLLLFLIVITLSASSFIVYWYNKKVVQTKAEALHWKEKAGIEEKFRTTILLAKQEWERTFDTMPDLIVILGRDHNIMRINKSFADRLGVHPREIIGKSFHQFIHGEEIPPESCLHMKALAEEKEQTAEVYLERLNGHFFVTVSPFYGNNHEMIGTVQVLHDITERKRMEQTLAESEEKYRGVVEGSLTGVYIHQDGVFKYINKRFCEILGYDYEEIIDKMGPLNLVHPEDKGLVQKKIDDRLEGRVQIAEYEARAVRKNGEIIPVRILGSVISYRGKPAIMGTVLDQSKEKALEYQLIQSQKMESLGQLAGGIAHDFNNILGIIVGSLDILQSTSPNERAVKYIDMSLEAARRGSDIVKRLLLFARAEEAKLVPVALATVIEELVKILKHTFEKNITIKSVIIDPSPVIMGNREQLLQALLNICVNARDAMSSGGTLSIRIESAGRQEMKLIFPELGKDSYYVMRIADTGVGMNRQTRERIFDPFFTTKERGRGTGLGLSIVHGVVKNHKGFIDVKSTPGRGTTFSLYFPKAKIPAQTTEAPKKIGEIKGGSERILVVEDEEALRKLLKETFTALGYEVLEATNGFEAIDLFREKADLIDLVILDIGLPGMTGDLVAMKLKAIRAQARIVIASGYLEFPRKEELLKLGMKEFIQKPYSIKDIANTVRRILDEAPFIPS